MKPFLFVLEAALLCLSLQAYAVPSGPEESTANFYRWALAHPSGALPSAKQRGQLARILSPQLIQLLKDASATQARCVKAAPKDEKPLIIEGDLFVGNYEGASEVAYGSIYQKEGTATVEANLVYVDRRFPKAHKHRTVAWKDSLELRLHGDAWLVSDIRYEQGGSLTGTLKDYLLEGSRSCVTP